eukprot:2983316-Amphidinium_carterae.1
MQSSVIPMAMLEFGESLCQRDAKDLGTCEKWEEESGGGTEMTLVHLGMGLYSARSWRMAVLLCSPSVESAHRAASSRSPTSHTSERCSERVLQNLWTKK